MCFWAGSGEDITKKNELKDKDPLLEWAGRTVVKIFIERAMLLACPFCCLLVSVSPSNSQGFSVRLEQLRHPTSWTEYLPDSQPLQHAADHRWTVQLLLCKSK